MKKFIYRLCVGQKWESIHKAAGKNRSNEAGFTLEREQNANVNAVCENDVYVYVGKFVHCLDFAMAVNRPCSQAPVIPNVKKKKHIVCEFLLKYRHLADSIRLFAECSSHSRMLFASPQEYIYIERSHHFCMPCSRSDVNAA